MKVELKEIIDQLSDAITLQEGYKVSALIDDNTGRIVGWTIVEVADDGTISMVDKDVKFDNIKELLKACGF
jgi:hypothetical protein